MNWELFVEGIKEGLMLPNALNSLQWAAISFLCWILMTLLVENKGLKEIIDVYEEEKGEREDD